MGNDKLSVDCQLFYHLYLLRVHPYSVDRVYSALIEIAYQLFMNTIFLMDGVFRCRTHLMGSPI